MLKFIEVTGKNEDDAISKALTQLGLDRDDVSVEILERAKSGFLGIGSVPAKIRVSYEVPDEEVKPAAQETFASAVEEKKPSVLEQKEKKTGFVPKQSETTAQPTSTTCQTEPETPTATGEDDTVQRITQFLNGLFQHMDVNATPEITREGDIYSVVLRGEDLGSLIGRRGETLDAIQQLTGYAINHGRSRRVRIHMDAENYRARREESLERLARKVAGKVIKYRRNVTLEPMNAYERHVIHTALQDYPGVSTYSTGVEPNRRTIVAYNPNHT